VFAAFAEHLLIMKLHLRSQLQRGLHLRLEHQLDWQMCFIRANFDLMEFIGVLIVQAAKVVTN
jgi:hypothetical protein